MNKNKTETLKADAKTLRDISALFIREGSFHALPSILDSIAADILEAVGKDGDASDAV